MSIYMDNPDQTRGQHGAHLTTQQARSGETSGHVRFILATSLILAMVAFAILLTVML